MKYTIEQLIEKIVRATVKIEAIPHRDHAPTCPYEDPESYAPCGCKAGAQNSAVQAALKELKL